MTLKEFWNSKEKLAINCETKEQDEIFRKESDKLGYKFDNNCKNLKSFLISYLKLKVFQKYKEDTCYSNRFSFCDKKFYEDNRYKILNFEDIDWGFTTKQQELYAKYGKDNQINIVIEEMSELTKELLKDKRGFDNRPQIVEELADVLFVLEYVKIAFDIKQEELDQVLKNKGLKE